MSKPKTPAPSRLALVRSSARNLTPGLPSEKLEELQAKLDALHVRCGYLTRHLLALGYVVAEAKSSNGADLGATYGLACSELFELAELADEARTLAVIELKGGGQ